MPWPASPAEELAQGRAARAHGTIPPVVQQSRRMPAGVILFLVYGFIMLGIIGLTLPKVD